MKIFSDNTRHSYVKALFLIHSLWLVFITLKYHVQETTLKKMNDSISDINGSMIKNIMEEVRREVNTVQEVAEVKDSKLRTHPTKENIHRKSSFSKLHDKNKDVKEKSGIDKIEIPSSHNKYNSIDHKRNLNFNQIDLDCLLLDEVDKTSYSHDFYSMAFDLRMNIKTDGKPDQSWTLMSQDGRNDKVLIDSKSHTSTAPNKLKPQHYIPLTKIFCVD
eukprot:CAMPEP_0178952570 /NCGR_PEP_ID=MMETSP0789-20121207/7911_1 /TAXON_ID=3005 /ORGANISM="Rhizosolenia setigera, Strain CCMP 1694" /LENGTH=217 /DNA_ID=CAMNT_0020633681 /DNA_START=238 /DNA_END=891 /DNA_ORIENTATION=-